jgi:hypothetical protein
LYPLVKRLGELWGRKLSYACLSLYQLSYTGSLPLPVSNPITYKKFYEELMTFFP